MAAKHLALMTAGESMIAKTCSSTIPSELVSPVTELIDRFQCSDLELKYLSQMMHSKISSIAMSGPYLSLLALFYLISFLHQALGGPGKCEEQKRVNRPDETILTQPKCQPQRIGSLAPGDGQDMDRKNVLDISMKYKILKELRRPVDQARIKVRWLRSILLMNRTLCSLTFTQSLHQALQYG